MSQPNIPTELREATVNRFADEFGWDRRTIKRRLMADGCQPIRVEGKAEYYSADDVFRVMKEREAVAEDEALLERIAYAEKTAMMAFTVACDALPGAVREMAELDKVKSDLVAARIWLVLATTLGEYFSEGRPVKAGPVDIPLPASIQRIFAALGKPTKVYRHDPHAGRSQFTVKEHTG